MFNPTDPDGLEESARPYPIKYQRKGPNLEFGSARTGDFSPNGEGTSYIRETTLSLIFDCTPVQNGSYWTMFSIGQYSDKKAFSHPNSGALGERFTYTAPEEIFLDKLGW